MRYLFLALMLPACAAVPVPPAADAAQIVSASFRADFDRRDRDRDGALTPAELPDSGLDRNGDGRVTFGEYLPADALAQYVSIIRIQAHYELKRDGGLSQHEYELALARSLFP